MKTPVAVSFVVVGGSMMLAALFFDCSRQSVITEALGFGIGGLMVAVAGIFANRSDAATAAKSADSMTDWLMVLITFAGFGITIYTIRDAAETFKSTNYSAATPIILDLDKKFVEQPELRKYFYQDGTDELICVHPGETNYAQVMAMSEYILDTFDSFLAQRVRYGRQTIDPDWTDWMKDTFSHSPSLVLYMDEHQNWYRSGVLYSNVYAVWLNQNPDGLKKAEQLYEAKPLSTPLLHSSQAAAPAADNSKWLNGESRPNREIQ